jgi:hypothetical protein
VTFPTSAGSAVRRITGEQSFLPAIQQLGRMATDTVLVNHLCPGFPDEDDLRFTAQGKDGGMPQPILSLEQVLTEKTVMRHMTVIAIGPFPVRTVAPRGILGRHNMAVDAGLGIVRQIGVSFRQIYSQQKKT